MDTRVYTDPLDPDAPQVGDLVVVATDHHPSDGASYNFDQTGRTGVVRARRFNNMYRWAICGSGWESLSYAVRRPTEAELAAWVLTHPGGAP